MNKLNQIEIDREVSRKAHLMKMLVYAESIGSKEGAETYSDAVSGCDVAIARLKAQKEPTGFSLAEARLWREVAKSAIYNQNRWQQDKKADARQCRIGATVCFIIVAAVILAVALFGCHTVSGIGQDLSTWSSPYIQENEK